MVAHAFSPSTWGRGREAEAGLSLWLGGHIDVHSELVLGQVGLHIETLSQNKTKNPTRTKNNKTNKQQEKCHNQPTVLGSFISTWHTLESSERGELQLKKCSINLSVGKPQPHSCHGPLTQVLMLWGLQPFHCYSITVMLLLLWIIMEISVFSMVLGDPCKGSFCPTGVSTHRMRTTEPRACS